MRTNPFQKIYDICNSGNSKEKLRNLPEFPRYVDIELTNTCNFRCLMCPTGVMSQKRKTGFMSDEIFYKILSEVKVYKTPLRFILWGEPTLHPKLIEYIKAAKKHGIICHFNTNASRMDDDMIAELLEIQLDSIKFSFQGVDRKSYLEMRNINFYDELIEIIKKFFIMRGERQFPYMHISTTITYETREQVAKFREEVSPYVDKVSVGRTILSHIDMDMVKLGEEEKKTLLRLKEEESIVKVHQECPAVFDKLSICWDGKASACCADYDNKMTVGDIKDSSLKEIWHSDELNRYREILADMRHDELELCKTCYDQHSLQTPGLQKT